MALADLWPVLVLDGGGGALLITRGSASFAGTGTLVATPTVAHGLPAGCTPIMLVPLAALYTGGGGGNWVGRWGQAAAADATNFYLVVENTGGFAGPNTYFFDWVAYGLL